MNISSRIILNTSRETLVLKNLVGREVNLHVAASNRTFPRNYSTNRKVTLDYVVHDDNNTDDSELSPIIVCHGLFGNKRNWNSLSKRLNKETGRKVITYDAINHGNSSHHPDMSYQYLANDLIHLHDILALNQSILIGHSMGGKTVMTAAMSQPNRIKKLVVVDAVPALSQSSGEVFTYMKLMDSMDLASMKSRKDVEEELKTVTNSTFMVNFLMTNLVSTPEGFHWRVNLKALISNYHYIHEFPVLSDDACYNGPTKFIGGGRSNYIQESDYSEIYKRFPNAEIEHIPGAGHFVHSEKPEEFFEITTKFLMQ